MFTVSKLYRTLCLAELSADAISDRDGLKHSLMRILEKNSPDDYSVTSLFNQMQRTYASVD
jgi:hypothetical protein